MTTTNKTNKPIDPPKYESDASDDDDDEDTVVGTCLHCNCPPPPRSERTGSTFSCSPCPASDPNAASGGGGEGTRVQVSCDDCRSFICDGECVLMLMMINIFLYEIYYILNSTCKLYQLTNLPFYRMPLVSRIPSQS